MKDLVKEIERNIKTYEIPIQGYDSIIIMTDENKFCSLNTEKIEIILDKKEVNEIIKLLSNIYENWK